MTQGPGSPGPRLPDLALTLGPCLALDSVVQLVGHCPANCKVTGLIPCQGTHLGCEFSPQLRHIQEATD